MARLVQTRPCDGACCRAAPLFPEKVGDRECKYRDPSAPETGCRVMRGEITLEGEDLVNFKRSCDDWPHNMPGRPTNRDCCWQWVDG